MSAYPAGIGNPQQAMQATAAMRAEPWYQQLVRSWGLDPKGDANGNVALSDQQRQKLLDTARQHGIGISDRYEIDPNGQIAEPESHWLRNTLIGAGIAGSMFIPGVGPAVLAGLHAAGSGIGAGLSALGHGAGGFFNAVRGLGAGAGGGSDMASDDGGGGFFDLVKNIWDNGGNSLAKNLISPAGEIGQTAGSIEAAREKALVDQAKLQQEQDANQIAKNKAVLDAPQALAKNAVRGDILANAQDATISGLPDYIHVPTIGGGLRPSLFSAATRNLGSQMSSKALQDFQSGTYTDPTLTPLPEASAFDKILSGTALAGGFLNASRGLLPKHIAGDNSDTTGGVDPTRDPYGPSYLPVGPNEELPPMDENGNFPVWT